MINNASDTSLLYAIALMRVSGVGHHRYQKLVARLGSAEAVLKAPVAKLKSVAGISEAVAQRIQTDADLDEARQIAGKIIELGWDVMPIDSDSYPSPLKNIPSPPGLLFGYGDLLAPDEPTVGVVGTRHPTEEGALFARRLARGLAEAGVTVVSGMAEGIDTAAHRGALDVGGKTVAVWGSSLDIVYPRSNERLASQIAEQGAVYSEYFPQTWPDRTTFPQRNRIIAGLSAGVVVVEAGRRSGALITATHALEQGRELFAVPGAPYTATSEGANELIKQGAGLVTSVADIFDALPRLRAESTARRVEKRPDLTESELKIVELFADGPQQIDYISRSLQLPVGAAMELLLALELKGVVQELSGKRYVLTEHSP